ncbi:MAG: tagaturonate epimerase family protein [Terriglobia bacterium]
MSPAQGWDFAADEVAAIAERILRHVDGKPLDGHMRGRIARDLSALRLSSLQPYVGSLEEDPACPSNYYLAADARAGDIRTPVLLHLAPGSERINRLFPKRIAAERVEVGGREIVAEVVPFASRDHENIRIFAERINPAFLPRPQGALPAIAAGNRHPEISLPAVFEAYRVILEKMHVNMASTVQLSATREMTTDEALAARDGENPTAAGHTRVSIRHLYHAGLWAAIRAGWREGYNAEADHFIVAGNTPDEIHRSVEAVKAAIRQAAGYTKFTTDTSRLFELEADLRHPKAWGGAVVEERFRQLFSPDEQGWILAEFSQPFAMEGGRYVLAREEIVRLAVKFGESLKLNEELFDTIRAAKAQLKFASGFDFEPSLDEAETLTTAQELLFYMHWLKARGRPAQLVPPNLGFKKRQAYPETMESVTGGAIGLKDYCHHKMWHELLPRAQKEFSGKPLDELGARVLELAAVARYFDGTLSIHSGSGKQPAVLERIGKATAGRVNYKISGELQLQLFDVLYEQPSGSRWRQLHDRMVERTNQFAATGAFGAESELAAEYVKMGRGSYLGDTERGRVDGNLFLVFWLGNVVGSHDISSPDGDLRFFKEKLDELPEDLLQEVRQRNTRYVVWLAEHLRG